MNGKEANEKPDPTIIYQNGERALFSDGVWRVQRESLPSVVVVNGVAYSTEDDNGYEALDDMDSGDMSEALVEIGKRLAACPNCK